MNFIIRAYSVFVVVWFLANQFVQDIWWPLVVLDKFANFFLLAAFPVFLISLLHWFTVRKNSILLLSLLPVLVVGFFYVPLLVSDAKYDDQQVNSTLRVATYNIWNHNKDLAGAVELINATSADVVAVQELTDVQQAEFVQRLSKTYPHYHVSQQVYGGTTALFSKLELQQIEELDFQIDRPAIVATVNINDAAVGVISAHLNPSYWAYHDQPLLKIPARYHQYIKDQNLQASTIIDALSKRGNLSGSILACDCNSQETASTNRLLRTHFEDAFRFVGMQFGDTGNELLGFERKLSHIDYIWFSGELAPLAVYRAKQTAGSDHAPVLAEFTF